MSSFVASMKLFHAFQNLFNSASEFLLISSRINLIFRFYWRGSVCIRYYVRKKVENFCKYYSTTEQNSISTTILRYSSSRIFCSPKNIELFEKNKAPEDFWCLKRFFFFKNWKWLRMVKPFFFLKFLKKFIFPNQK